MVTTARVWRPGRPGNLLATTTAVGTGIGSAGNQLRQIRRRWFGQVIGDRPEGQAIGVPGAEPGTDLDVDLLAQLDQVVADCLLLGLLVLTFGDYLGDSLGDERGAGLVGKFRRQDPLL